MVVEVVDVMVSNFHEGWKRKGGVEVGEKWWRSRAAPLVDRSIGTRRPVDRRPEAKVKGEKEKGKGKGKRGGILGAALECERFPKCG